MLSKAAVGKGRLGDLAAVAGEFKSFRPAAETLTRVRAVPTIFAQFDHATRVGGLPIERFTLLHGPSGEGKTLGVLGLLRSFLERDHFGVLIDAERTTPRDWVDKYVGPYARPPGEAPAGCFFYKEPSTYEATVRDVRDFVNTLRRLRDAGRVPEETTALIVVDSIRKLVPENIFQKITQATRAQGGGAEKVRDRSAQIKAAMNAAWMDEMIPMLAESKAAMLVIARESEDPDADARSRMFGTNYRVGSGQAIYYDASLVLRVERARYVTKDAGEGKKPIVYGERHRITIRKSKVAGREEKQPVCYFHSSNGVLVPEGFDRARDVLELARRFGIVKGDAWLKWRSSKWQGEHASVRALHAAPEKLDALEAEVRAKFVSVNPVEVTEDGEGRE